MADKNMEAQISVEFEEATSRQSLNSGETINTLWGKVKRWLSDLKAVAFSGSYIDLSDRPTTATISADGLMSAEDKSKLDDADNTYALKSKYGDTTINVGRKAGTTVGAYSTSEGDSTTASGGTSHAEGFYTKAIGVSSHAEGSGTTASGGRSHAEGYSTNLISNVITDFSPDTTNDDIIAAWKTNKFSLAKGNNSHSEGFDTLALGNGSHAEGRLTTASGTNSHAGGWCTEALHDNEVSYGKYNKSNNDTLFSIGDGTADDARHNAFEITTTGGKLHDKDIATTDLIPASLPANGGVAENISEWGTRTYSDLNNADFGFSASCSDVGHLNAPNSFWSTVLTTGSNDMGGYKTQFAFPWSSDTYNQKMKYRVMDGNVWYDWSEMYTSSNKPYVTGSATIPADSDTCTTYHGFMPSSAIWWCDDICGAAVSFNENQITVGSTSSTYRTINYLIFK